MPHALALQSMSNAFLMAQIDSLNKTNSLLLSKVSALNDQVSLIENTTLRGPHWMDSSKMPSSILVSVGFEQMRYLLIGLRWVCPPRDSVKLQYSQPLRAAPWAPESFVYPKTMVKIGCKLMECLLPDGLPLRFPPPVSTKRPFNYSY